jgi:hypothetical protein
MTFVHAAAPPDGSWLTALIDAVVGLMELIGPAGAGLAIALENLFPPLPSEVILPMAGLDDRRGDRLDDARLGRRRIRPVWSRCLVGR